MNCIFKNLNFSFLAIVFISLSGCAKESSNSLTVSRERVDFQKEGGTISLIINTDAESWNITHPASSWLVLSETSGTEKTANVSLSVGSKTLYARFDTLTISAGKAKPVKVPVKQPSSEYLYNLTTSYSSLTFKKAGNSSTLTVNTDATQWNLTSDANWLQSNVITGNFGITPVIVTASENTGSTPRTGTITITAVNTPTVQISVLQKGDYYPSYNTSPIAPDATGMSDNSTDLAAKMNLGWNIGNTLEATGGETAWGNPLITKALIDLVKLKGFNAIRIPCSWDQYMYNSSTAQLKTEWLNRVKEVIQYCIDDDMYVLLNIHWDGGWLENNCTADKEEGVIAKQKAFWEQIATKMRDFDEHLLFASANEPNVTDATQMAVLNSYHQTFINAVRSTGGRNSYRVLVIQGPSTDIDKTHNLMLSLPTDPASNRLMVEIHYYTPWNFCGMDADQSWGNMFYYWGKNYHSPTDLSRNATFGEEDNADANFLLMKNQFVDKGIPVILGEYGAIRRSSLTGDNLARHLASRAHFLKYVTRQAKVNGIIPFYWDNGGTGNNTMAIFNRSTNTVFDQQALDSLILGATK